jgi:glutamate-ammonia-ligase adenylyltransferase
MADDKSLLTNSTQALPGCPGELDFVASVFAVSPYLARLADRRPDTLRAIRETAPKLLLERLIEAVHAAGHDCTDINEFDTALRDAKADLHLIVGLADLASLWSVSAVTLAVSQFADAAVQASLHAHIRFLAEQGRAYPVTDQANPLPGFYIFALGKMGSQELNYSSDIDIVCFFDPDRVELPDNTELSKRLPRLVQALVKTLQNITPDGYVFRTDLRLRPDPGSSPVAMSSDAALNYYEAYGQTWERAAWIKARPCAGDFKAAAAYLTLMQPFIWRRSLDYAAVDDIRGLARQIQTVGNRAHIQPAGHDLKLGRGGIREIEFYAQIPQLVFGGRDASVRVPATRMALAALQKRGVITEPVFRSLCEDYETLRAWEHRVQMLQDEPSQTLPHDDLDRAAIASMAGYGDLAKFDTAVARLLRRVHGHFSEQFHGDDALSSEAGTLVLTGVEPTPDTLQTLTVLGFEKPEQVWKRLSAWAAGRATALRSNRARNLFAKIAPRLVDIIAATGEPDAAFVRFEAFLEQLPYGVQPLSLLINEPRLAADLIAILTMAPRMAQDLARRPDLLDAMLDKRFSTPLANDKPDSFQDRLVAQIGHSPGFEESLNLVRRLVREERFRVGSQVLRGTADAQTAGAAYTAIADAAIDCMAREAQSETCRRYGEMPGRYVVLGMGKLGGGELSADSDLDLMVVYDGEDTAQTWFTRFAQRFITALSVPTEEGELYEVDMQLRPSGKSGPVAVKLNRFFGYYNDEAWTWELMALTRARVVSGDSALGDKVAATIDSVLQKDRHRPTVLADARGMRSRLETEKPGQGAWDLKSRVGGLQDIEFIAQSLQVCAAQTSDVIRGATGSAFSALVRAGEITVDDALFLTESAQLYLGIAQLTRSAHGAGFDPDGASRGFAELLVELGGVDTLDDLQALLDRRCQRVRLLFHQYLQ